jgi:hypothetical protein
MTKFKATNSTTSAKRSFTYRQKYEREAFENNNTPEVRDLMFAENTLYGRVDTQLDTVFVKENSLQTTVSMNENTYRLLNFVSDAFNVVKQKMLQAKTIGIIPDDDPIFSTFSIKRAYEPPMVSYDNYGVFLMNRYIEDFLIGQRVVEKVFTLEQFVENFINYLISLPDHTPFTFTSWQRSTTSNIFTSGLAVNIAEIKIGDHPSVERNLLNSPAFNFYLKTCRANGFLVSEQMPSIMVADILSPGLAPYALNRQIIGTPQVFLRNYSYAFTVDYEKMVSLFVTAYNSFVGRYPFERLARLKCDKKTSVEIKYRSLITPQAAQDTYSKAFWLSTYTKIRNIEEEYALGKKMMNLILKNIKMTKNLDIFKSMRYINSTFRNTYKTKYGGANYYIHRFEERNKSTEPSTEVISDTSINTGGSSGGY